jgi:hypothetical protein
MIDEKYRLMGEKAWQEAHDRLVKEGWHIQQIDWLGEMMGEWVKFEIKCQEPFEPPPFEGHGLPRWQIESSEKLRKDKDIRTYLMIKDAKSGKWIGNFIDELEKGEYHDTHGLSPRRVYKISSFIELSPGEHESVVQGL